MKSLHRCFKKALPLIAIALLLSLSQAAAAVMPSINLDPSDTKGLSPGYKASFTEREGAVLLQAADAGISGIAPDRISVVITSPQIGDSLSADPLDTDIQVQFRDAALELTGQESIENYGKVLGTVSYNNPSADPDAIEQTIEFTPFADDVKGETVQCTLTIVPVNNAPIHEYPEQSIVPRNTYLIFSAVGGNPIRVMDQDAREGEIKVTLSVTNGTLTPPADMDDELKPVIDTETVGQLIITGTLARVNTALDGLRYNPAEDWQGKEILSIKTNDMGYTGTPGPQVTEDDLSILVIVPTEPPEDPDADAGSDREVNEFGEVTLNGTGSSSPNGDIISYQWKQASGPSVTLDNADTAMPSFTAPEYDADNADILFTLTVTDSAGKTGADTTTVTLLPVDRIDGVFEEGSTVFLNGPTEGISAYEWKQLAGPDAPLSDPAIQSPSFVAPMTGAEITRLVFRLTILKTDNTRLTSENFINIRDNGITGYPDDVITFRPTTDTTMGIRIENGDPVNLYGVDVNDTSAENRPENLIYGLIDLKINVSEPGRNATAVIYLEDPADEAYDWFKYDEKSGWYDFNEFAEFSSDRSFVRLFFKDGGAGDADGTANGTIHDPSGLGRAPSSPPSEGGDGEGGCFINTLSANRPKGDWNRLGKLAGRNNAVLVTDAGNKILYSQNEQKPMIPASTLKLLTALISRHYLSPSHRFKTEFYINAKNDLIIKGYGDPLLISEVVADIARALGSKLDSVHDIILDDTRFKKESIPGVTSSLNPYDSPNGALCVNFNTVTFQKKGRSYVSAEPQTPLLPFVMPRIKQSGLKQERIVLSSQNNETLLYAGHLFRFFMEKEGIRVSGDIRPGQVPPAGDQLLYTHISPFSLDQVIERLMEYSNNYIANQLFITSGIHAYGPPGSLEKGNRAAAAYVADVLKQKGIRLAEGSGISRKNRITARQLLNILNHFEPYHHLLRNKGREYYKTGSLTGVKSRAGFIEGNDGSFYRFVILINTPGKRTEPVVRHLKYLLHKMSLSPA